MKLIGIIHFYLLWNNKNTCKINEGHSILYPHPPPPHGRGQSKFTPLEIKDQKCRHVHPFRNCLNSLFPSEKSQFFSEPLGKIQKIKGADAATPSEMTIKGPSENLFHREGGGVWILNGMALSYNNLYLLYLTCTRGWLGGGGLCKFYYGDVLLELWLRPLKHQTMFSCIYFWDPVPD